MKNDLIKQEFIIKSLKPYFEDRNNCGYDKLTHRCEYKTSDGKKCAVGQYLNTDEYNESGGTFNSIGLKYTDFNDILVDEAKNMLSLKEWSELQMIHDNLAQNSYDMDNVTYLCNMEKLSEVDLTELKQMLPNYEPIIF